MNIPDNDFSKKIKRIFVLTNNTKMLHWNLADMEIVEGRFCFSVRTPQFNGGISVLQSNDENIVGVSFCKDFETTMNLQDFNDLLESRIKLVHVYDLVKHLESIVTEPIGHRAPDCNNVPRVATA